MKILGYRVWDLEFWRERQAPTQLAGSEDWNVKQSWFALLRIRSTLCFAECLWRSFEFFGSSFWGLCVCLVVSCVGPRGNSTRRLRALDALHALDAGLSTNLIRDHWSELKRMFTPEIRRYKSQASPIERFSLGILSRVWVLGFGFVQFAPFGGVKQSGHGREGSKYGLAEYMEVGLTWE